MAAEFEPYLREEAERRMKAGKADPGTKPGPGSRDNSKRSINQAADLAGVGKHSAAAAVKAKKQDPAVFQKLKEDKITVAEADREMKAKGPTNGHRRGMLTTPVAYLSGRSIECS